MEVSCVPGSIVGYSSYSTLDSGACLTEYATGPYYAVSTYLGGRCSCITVHSDRNVPELRRTRTTFVLEAHLKEYQAMLLLETFHRFLHS